MTHILIVDDEGLERTAMKKILSTAFPKVQQIGEASNGLEAIDYVKEDPPDLVLMDIKMPGMDGLKAIQEIKVLNEQTRFIMVSAFDTFEYAQKAIREGVKDYLVKPSKKKDIIETISRVLEDIERDKSQQEETTQTQVNYHKALIQLQTDWVASLLLNHINRESFLVDVFSVGDYEHFLAMVLDVGPVGQEAEELSSEELTQFKEEAADILRSASPAAIGPMMGTYLPVLLPFNEGEKEVSIQSRTIALARQVLKESEKRHPHLKCRIGIGTPVKEVYDFASSYQKALLALEATSDNVPYLYYHPSLLTKRTASKLDDYEQSLLDVVRTGNTNGFERLYNNYFKELATTFDQDLDKMVHHLEELRILINRYLKEWQSDLFLSEHSLPSQTLVQLREFTRSRLSTLVQHIHQWHSEQAKGVIFKAKEWIDDHFVENVTLDDVAAMVQLSPFYFSKLFKEQFGQTFIDYLTQKRIELAKRLLLRTEKTFKEICFEVGYRDPNYFSRVFKKITGQTPSEFRKMA